MAASAGRGMPACGRALGCAAHSASELAEPARRALATASTRALADPSLAASTSAPALPPTLRELQTSLRAPPSAPLAALDALLQRQQRQQQQHPPTGVGAQAPAQQAAPPDTDGAAAVDVDTALLRQLVPRDLSPQQISTVRALRRHNSSLPYLRGQYILAHVLSVNPDRVIVDTGYSGPSEVPRASVTIAHLHIPEGSESPIDRSSSADIRPGDILRLRVDAPFTPYGDMQLSAVREDAEEQRRAVWIELRRRMAAALPVQGRVLNAVDGGFAVGVAGYVALLPHRFATRATAQRVGVAQPFYILDMSDSRRLITLRDASLVLRGGG